MVRAKRVLRRMKVTRFGEEKRMGRRRKSDDEEFQQASRQTIEVSMSRITCLVTSRFGDLDEKWTSMGALPFIHVQYNIGKEVTRGAEPTFL